MDDSAVVTAGKQEKKRSIGIFAPVWHEVGNRWIEGILQYIAGVPALGFRDFRFLDYFEIGAGTPPWQGQVDGIVLAFGLHDREDAEDAMRWIERGGVPAVSLAWDWQHPRLPLISTDIGAVAECAADYLHGREFRNCLMIDDEVGKRHCTLRKAFQMRLAKHGHQSMDYVLSFRPEGTQEDFERIQGETGLADLLRQAPKPLGVFALTDIQARVVCWMCREIGLEVPGEVAVLGCGDLSIARLHSPPISSVATRATQVGHEAARVLHRLIDGGEAPDRSLLIRPLGVVERESTRPSFRGFGDVDRALEFIRLHACEGITVNDVVKHLRMSRRTLEKHFSEQLGCSPGHEIQRLRLSKAKSLLAETSLPISKVAELTGFVEISSLSNFIRKHTGFSPSLFRQRNQAR